MKQKTSITEISILASTLLLTAFPVRADDLAAGFRNPPGSRYAWCLQEIRMLTPTNNPLSPGLRTSKQ
jgi:hypothetical protein